MTFEKISFTFLKNLFDSHQKVLLHYIFKYGYLLYGTKINKFLAIGETYFLKP